MGVGKGDMTKGVLGQQGILVELEEGHDVLGVDGLRSGNELIELDRDSQMKVGRARSASRRQQAVLLEVDEGEKA